MIVSEIMTTKMVTVSPDDTLVHAANLFRQYQFHHLPVVRHIPVPGEKHASYVMHKTLLELQGLLTSEDIDLVVAASKQSSSGDLLRRSWQEQHVSEVMHHAFLRVTPNTSVGAAVQLLVERGLNYLPVVDYTQIGEESETRTILVGLLTRSDLLIVLARSLGTYEPGMQLVIPLQNGDLTPLAQTLLLAGELHIHVRSILAAPLEGGTPHSATLRVATINPAPLLVRLREAHIEYTFVDPQSEDTIHV